jgi:hypothetical protein
VFGAIAAGAAVPDDERARWAHPITII